MRRTISGIVNTYVIVFILSDRNSSWISVLPLVVSEKSMKLHCVLFGALSRIVRLAGVPSPPPPSLPAEA